MKSKTILGADGATKMRQITVGKALELQQEFSKTRTRVPHNFRP